MSRSLCFVLLLGSLIACHAQPAPPVVSAPLTVANSEFWTSQLRFPRVRAAQAATGPAVAHLLRTHSLSPQRLEVFFRLLKTRATLEVWARNRDGGSFELLREYPLAATSGTLGPKRHAGDRQVPEGCYEIDRFNPNSLFHLSLGLNYPNAADRSLGIADPGGDIFIHGSNVSIGCLPITDAGIEEVYLLAGAARAAGQVVLPVHIFPFPLTEAELARRKGSPHLAFWRGLQPAYAYFEQYHKLAVDDFSLTLKQAD